MKNKLSDKGPFPDAHNIIYHYILEMTHIIRYLSIIHIIRYLSRKVRNDNRYDMSLCKSLVE